MSSLAHAVVALLVFGPPFAADGRCIEVAYPGPPAACRFRVTVTAPPSIRISPPAPRLPRAARVPAGRVVARRSLRAGPGGCIGLAGAAGVDTSGAALDPGPVPTCGLAP